MQTTITTQFFSITKFVEFMHNIYPDSTAAFVYFESSDTFKNKFNKICIKPVFITIHQGLTTTRNLYLKHKGIINLFGIQPIISFNEHKYTSFTNSNNSLLYLSIYFKPKQYNDAQYYPFVVFKCIVNKNIELIRKNEIKNEQNNSSIFFNSFEDEIPDNVF